jgi:membrane fusion protein (multidrug efflux system)
VEATTRGSHTAAEASVREAKIGLSTGPDEVARASAQVSAAQAMYRKTDVDLERAKTMFAKRLISPQQLDATQNAADAATASLAEAQAHLRIAVASTDAAHARVTEAQARLTASGAVGPQIAEARAKAAAAQAAVQAAEAARNIAALDLSYAHVVAPVSGIASNRSFTAGQMVTAGEPLLMIVPTDDVWVIANFKETQLGRMRARQPARIHVDSYPDLDVSGTVESLSAATGAHFSLLPPDNATGNFVKVVQRVPVRIRLHPWSKDRVLRPGMSVVATVTVGN